VKPFRGLLLGFFFITVGMVLDIGVLVQQWRTILLLLSLLILIKAAFTSLAAITMRTPKRNAIQLGFLLSQGSEFAFVILAIPALASELGSELSMILVTVVAASMALSPPLAMLGNKIARKIASRDWEAQHGEVTPTGPAVAPVVIVGMGALGRRVADGLDVHGITYTAIEKDYDAFITANADGYPVAFGDAADTRLMESIEMPQRLTVVITLARYDVSRDLTPIVRERYPHLRRIISVEDDASKARFEELGMIAVVSRSVPEGLDLAAMVLKEHGVNQDRIQSWMQRQQAEALETQAALVGSD